MRAEKVINTLLNGAAGVTALVGSGAAARIYPPVLPQGVAFPCIAVEHITTVELDTIDALSAYGLVRTRIQVTAIAKDYPGLKALMDEVRKACNYQRGVISGVRVVSVVRDSMGPDDRDDALGVVSQSIDFQVTHQEP